MAALNLPVPSNVAKAYTLAVSAAAGPPPTFSLSATPTASQSADLCGTLSIDQAGVKTAVKGGAAVTGCW